MSEHIAEIRRDTASFGIFWYYAPDREKGEGDLL
jgi:hypothetical protein